MLVLVLVLTAASVADVVVLVVVAVVLMSYYASRSVCPILVTGRFGRFGGVVFII